MLNTLYSFKEIEIYEKFINCLMQKGKRDKSLALLFATLSEMQAKMLNKEPNRFRKFRTFEPNISQKNFRHLGFNHTKCLNTKKVEGKLQIKDISKISLADKTNIEQLSNVFLLVRQGIDNISPYLEVRKSRVSGKTRQIPAMIRKKRQQTLAIRWLIDAAQKRQKTSMTFSECLASELLEASQKQGGARQKRNELHKIAHANRTFLRYRWW